MIARVTRALEHYGIRLDICDLGDWSPHELRAEYDPQGPVIRVNLRSAARYTGAQRDRFIAFAAAHELYHHREHCGEVKLAPTREERERAADDFAKQLLA